MKVFGVIGWKNAGKTGLMERLVSEITRRGFAVSTVKHAHHAFDLDHPGKDSFRHREAGAREVLLASYRRWALLHEVGDEDEPPLAELLAKLAPCDLVLVEGYKRDAHAKIEVFRDVTGHELIQPGDPTVRAVACDIALPDCPVPVFDLDDTGAIADFILSETGLVQTDAPDRLGCDCFAQPEAQGLATVAELQSRLRASLRAVTGVETVPLAGAKGRILAQDMTARRANPPATNSAMDGYAFAHASLPATDGGLPVVEGRSAAGAPYGQAVPPGHAVRIFTGALLPEGTDSVEMQENTSLKAGRLMLSGSPAPGANTRAKGEDVAAGAQVLAAGRWLGPQELGLLAAVGVPDVSVRARLRVGVLSTGDEVVAPGATTDPGKTYDANRPMLIGMVEDWGHEAVDLGHVPDDPVALRTGLDAAADRVDAILTSGGASVGDEDHVSALLRAEGQVAQWRVAMKPGKPLLLAQWRRVPVFGLPGNPVSAFATACLFVHPALSVLAGGAWREARGFTLPAGFTWSKSAGRRTFLRARLTDDGAVEVFRADGSGMISGLAWADGFVELPEAACEIAPGDPVRYVPFSEFGLNP
jgi:molybdopterin molybdotransferase